VEQVRFKLNGEPAEVYVEPWWSLARVLREELGLTGLKVGCNEGDCGSCTVLIGGKSIRSCLYLAIRAEGKDIVTIEGLQSKDGRLDSLQEAFIEHFALQCGFCTPGMIMAAKGLLNENPGPSEDEVKQALGGNICRCSGYVKIVEAVLAAAEKNRGGRE
jgi:aerobic carbon-monoxide dehydrogenase small subunit